MEKSWVMSEEERLQLLRTRLQRRQAEQKQNCSSPSKGSAPSSPGSDSRTLSQPQSPYFSAYTADYSLIHQHLMHSDVSNLKFKLVLLCNSYCNNQFFFYRYNLLNNL